MKTSLDALVDARNVESALTQLRVELDEGRKGVLILTVDRDGCLTLSIFGEVSAASLALHGALITQRAMRVAEGGD